MSKSNQVVISPSSRSLLTTHHKAKLHLPIYPVGPAIPCFELKDSYGVTTGSGSINISLGKASSLSYPLSIGCFTANFAVIGQYTPAWRVVGAMETFFLPVHWDQ
uniref:Uncharacterized protein n=1 Tax=Salix viminalis TaxID=40686 RepID=A0A6N2L3H7_SALVM